MHNCTLSWYTFLRTKETLKVIFFQKPMLKLNFCTEYHFWIIKLNVRKILIMDVVGWWIVIAIVINYVSLKSMGGFLFS